MERRNGKDKKYNGQKVTKARKKNNFFHRFSKAVTVATGRPAAFIAAFIIVLIWGLSGPLFNFSDTWQLVINTGTTIITFLMVFVIQQSQNRDTMAIQLKLNELIAASNATSNRLIDIEDLSDEELMAIKKFYIQLANIAAKEDDIHSTHSLDEAESRSEKKVKPSKKTVKS